MRIYLPDDVGKEDSRASAFPTASAKKMHDFPASRPRRQGRNPTFQLPDHVGKGKTRLSSFPTTSASRLSTYPDFPLRRIEIVAPIPQVFDKTKGLLPIGQEDEAALNLGRQDEGFFS